MCVFEPHVWFPRSEICMLLLLPEVRYTNIQQHNLLAAERVVVPVAWNSLM